MQHGSIGPSGHLDLAVSRGGAPFTPLGALPPDPTLGPIMDHQSVAGILDSAYPQRHLPAEVNAWRKRNLRAGFHRQVLRHLLGRGALAAIRPGFMYAYGALGLRVIRGDGRVEDLGLASLRLVTTAAVNAIVDGLQSDTNTLHLWLYHGYGTGTTAAAVGDTDIETELTTQYTTNSTRPTGSQTEGASANIYRSVATLTPDSGGTLAITEHGVLTSATVGAGTLLDRHVFSAVNLDSANGDSLQTTYDLTVAAGG